MAASASTATITTKWDRQGECGGLENIKNVDTHEASNQICPVVVFLPLQTQRGQMWQFVLRNPASSSPCLSAWPPPTSSSRPLDTRRAAIGPSCWFSARATSVGGKGEPIRSCEPWGTARGTNENKKGRSGGLYVIWELMKSRDGSW